MLCREYICECENVECICILAYMYCVGVYVWG